MPIVRAFRMRSGFVRDRESTRTRRRSVSLFWLCLVIVGVFLMLLAFPSLIQASEDFLLQGFGPDVARPGDVISYTIEYQNLGWPLLNDVVLIGLFPQYTSPVSASPGCKLWSSSMWCVVGTLEQGEGGQVEVSLRVDEDVPSGTLLKSEVKAKGREPGGELMRLDVAWLRTLIVVPALEILKQPSASVIYAGEQVTYTYTLINTGDVALGSVAIMDDQKSPPQVCDSPAGLGPGEVLTCTWTTVLQVDATNTATGIGLDPWGGVVTDTATATVDVIHPGIEVVKTAGSAVIYAGEEVMYTYEVTNPGDDPLSSVSVTDDRCRPVRFERGDIDGDGLLDTDEVWRYACSAVLDEDTTNLATAEGTDSLGGVVTDTDSIFVNTVQLPGEGIINLEKVASAPLVYVGETVVYTYTVSNLSEDPIHNISLTDDHLGVIADSFDLVAGGSAIYVTETVLMTDTTNLATAVGYNLLGDEVSDDASVFVGVVPPDVALSLSVAANALVVYQGDTVTYTYIITNVGSDTAFNVVLSDFQSSAVRRPLDEYGPYTLTGGESVTISTAKSLDADTNNVVMATGTDALGRLLSATDSVFVNTIQRPGPDGEGILILSVAPSAMSVVSGTVVTYTYVVTNVSQDPVGNIVVEDEVFGYILPRRRGSDLDVPEGFALEAGESRTLTHTVTLYESTFNVAGASGEDLLGTIVSAEATAFVEVVPGPTHRYFVFMPTAFKNVP